MALLVRHHRSDFPKFFTPSSSLIDGFWNDLLGDVSFEKKNVLSSLRVAVDVKEEKDSFKVYADLPGIDENTLDLAVEDQVLTIKGEKNFEHTKEDKDTWYTERSFGSFERAIPLPTEIDLEKVSASYKNGVLEVVLPKAPEAQSKVKKIKIS